MWYLLAKHPEVQIRLAAEFDQLPWEETPTMDSLVKYTYTRQVIDEALRLYPPLWLMTRKALNDDQLRVSSLYPQKYIKSGSHLTSFSAARTSGRCPIALIQIRIEP